jgi:RloB-like protein
MSTQRGKPLSRRPGNREQRQRFLIVAEGDVSETIYLKGVKSDLGRSGPGIVLGTTHGESYGLVRDAIKHKHRELRADDPFTQVWCVFDVESPDPHPALDNAVQLAQRNSIHCAITNPCFELWLILHFRDQRDPLTTKAACDQLMGLPCDYSKHGKAFSYAQCREHRETATSRADALAASYDDTAPLLGRNPWTSVHELLRALQQATAA